MSLSNHIRSLGTSGPTASAIGLGAMGMSDMYGPADDTESVATLRAALDAGVTLIDTADFYGSGHNELLIREALRGRNREKAILSVKFGALRDPQGAFAPEDLRPEAIKNFLAYSLRRLGTDYIDIYRPARIPAGVRVEDVVGTIGEMVKAGYVRHVGLSEVNASTLRRAAAVHPISDLQIEYSLLSRGIEDSILPTARDLGIGITAYGVLSRGLLSGHWNPQQTLSAGDFRNFSPRFQGDNLQANLALVEALRKIAQAKKVEVAQVAIAWVLSRGPDVVALVGVRKRARLAESLAAADVELTRDDLSAIEKAIPAGAAAGERYPSFILATMDSEKKAA